MVATTHYVICHGDKCRGRVIAEILRYRWPVGGTHQAQQFQTKMDVRAIDEHPGKYGLEGHRVRLDGLIGFRCYCGNSTILAPEEEGIIGSHPPTNEEIEEILRRVGLRESPPQGTFELRAI